jgi:hypothetical protein
MIGFISTVYYNHSWSQSIFSRTLLPWLPRTRSILVPVLRLTSESVLYTYIVSRWTRRKHIFPFCCIYSVLHINEIIRCRGNVFSLPLPSNGHGADRIENTSYSTLLLRARGLHVTVCVTVSWEFEVQVLGSVSTFSSRAPSLSVYSVIFWSWLSSGRQKQRNLESLSSFL